MSVTTLNAIRATATSAYQETIPLATASNITEVGQAVMEAPSTIKNEFLSALINKVGLQLYNDRVFSNPLLDLKKGKLEYGLTIEDIFVEMANAKQYTTGTRVADSETGELEAVPDQFEVNKAIAKTGFYSKVFGKQYFKTVHRDDLKRAFFSGEGVNRLVSSIMTALTNGQNFDDYRMTIALIARQIEQSLNDSDTNWKGDVHLLTDYETLTGDTFTTPAEALADKGFLTYVANQFKKWSNRLTHPRSDLNSAGVITWTPKSEQRIMLLGDIQADIDTQLMAWAYNADRLEIGRVDEIDAWYSIGADGDDTPVVSPDDIIIKGEMGLADYEASEGTVYAPCLGVIYHPNMLKIYSKTAVSTTSENSRGLYYNIFNTFEDYFACSPFENFVAFFLD